MMPASIEALGRDALPDVCKRAPPAPHPRPAPKHEHEHDGCSFSFNVFVTFMPDSTQAPHGDREQR